MYWGSGKKTAALRRFTARSSIGPRFQINGPNIQSYSEAELLDLILLGLVLIVTIAVFFVFRSRDHSVDRNKYDSWVNHNDDIDD